MNECKLLENGGLGLLFAGGSRGHYRRRIYYFVGVDRGSLGS